MKNLKEFKNRTSTENDKLQSDVRNIIKSVLSEGDSFLRKINEKFDGSTREEFLVSREEIDAAYEMVSIDDINNMNKAKANIQYFAQAQKDTIKPLSNISPEKGIELGHRIIPIDSCCCYVPGGSYPLYSTALMLGIPAKIAGVKRVCACSPVVKGTNSIHPKTLVAMDMAGVDEIYAMGGAGAVAAFSYGTETISAVNLIVGPGNSYVTEAKRQCYGQVGIDFLAGPSEVLIIADKSANPKIIAADILAQSEHDLLARGILLTTDEQLGLDTIKEVEKQLEALSTKEIAKSSWENYGQIIFVNDLKAAIDYSNNYAPEHLEVMVNLDESDYIDKLTNYGSLFIGENTAEVFGDYASGTNHTLPTLGAAKYTGGVYVGTFLKTCTYQKLSQKASEELAPLVANLANGEGLDGHAKAATIRIKK